MRNIGPSGSRISFGGMSITPGVKLLLIANSAVFLLQFLFDNGSWGRLGPITQWFAFIPSRAIFGFEIWRFFTYMFLHGSLGHIGFNMLALWMFGSQVESRWGQRPFLTYYTICGLGGALTYGLFNLAGVASISPMLGASGAVYGLLLAYGLIFPDAVILVMLFFPMKAKYAVLMYGVIELMMSAGAGGGHVANLAHLGGMITGFIFLKTTIPSLNTGSFDLNGAWRRWQTKRRLKIVRPGTKNTPRKTNGSEPPAGPRSEIDVILDKISREGLQSLTDEEQETLRRAGRR